MTSDSEETMTSDSGETMTSDYRERLWLKGETMTSDYGESENIRMPHKLSFFRDISWPQVFI